MIKEAEELIDLAKIAVGFYESRELHFKTECVIHSDKPYSYYGILQKSAEKYADMKSDLLKSILNLENAIELKKKG